MYVFLSFRKNIGLELDTKFKYSLIYTAKYSYGTLVGEFLI